MPDSADLPTRGNLENSPQVAWPLLEVWGHETRWLLAHAASLLSYSIRLCKHGSGHRYFEVYRDTRWIGFSLSVKETIVHPTSWNDPSYDNFASTENVNYSEQYGQVLKLDTNHDQRSSSGGYNCRSPSPVNIPEKSKFLEKGLQQPAVSKLG
ncbi:hypothetical protein CPB83DRAFT_834466 [Crepidotus variabilis]|uniref:Uncharacterized protein n=1 Tax=Crepidotus variabilis TaxID=179855 RepID=A0A9P6EJD4_9AGAR|nr:hypothetical protein CPB83DRAFT_834466 [Crepidotus variabilis]